GDVRTPNSLRASKNFRAPLVKAKFGPASAQIPAAFLWGRIYPRSRSREKGKESLGYLRGGFARMCMAIADRLKEEGVVIRMQTRVQRIARRADSFDVQTAPGTEPFDRIICTG